MFDDYLARWNLQPDGEPITTPTSGLLPMRSADRTAMLDAQNRSGRPKDLIGERYFDYANLFCNPDAGTAIKQGRLARRAEVVASAAHLEYRRFRAWIVA